MNTKQKAQWIWDTQKSTCMHIQSVICTCYRVQNIFGKRCVHRVSMFHCCLALKSSSCAQVIPRSLYLERNNTNCSKSINFEKDSMPDGLFLDTELKTYFQLFTHDSLKRSRLVIIRQIATCNMKLSHNWSCKGQIRSDCICFFNTTIALGKEH